MSKVFLVSLDSQSIGFYVNDYITADDQTTAENIMIARHVEDTAGGTEVRSEDITEEYNYVCGKIEALDFKIVVDVKYTVLKLEQDTTTHITYSGIFNTLNGVYEFNISANGFVSATNRTERNRKRYATQTPPRRRHLKK